MCDCYFTNYLAQCYRFEVFLPANARCLCARRSHLQPITNCVAVQLIVHSLARKLLIFHGMGDRCKGLRTQQLYFASKKRPGG